MDYGEFVELALKLPECVESLSYGQSAVKRGKRAMFAWNKKENAVALKLDWENHDELLEEHPEIFFKTPHYDGWPRFLIRIEEIPLELAEKVIRLSYDDAPNPVKIRR